MTLLIESDSFVMEDVLTLPSLMISCRTPHCTFSFERHVFSSFLFDFRYFFDLSLTAWNTEAFLAFQNLYKSILYPTKKYSRWPIFCIYLNVSKRMFSTIARRVAFGNVLAHLSNDNEIVIFCFETLGTNFANIRGSPFNIALMEEHSNMPDRESVALNTRQTPQLKPGLVIVASNDDWSFCLWKITPKWPTSGA